MIRRRTAVLLGVGTVAVAIGVALAVLALTQRPPDFSGVMQTLGSATGCDCAREYYPNVTLPGGVTVRVDWTDASRGTVEFLYIGPTGEWLECGPAGSNGSCSFGSVGGVYAFTAWNAASEAAQTVDYSGHY